MLCTWEFYDEREMFDTHAAPLDHGMCVGVLRFTREQTLLGLQTFSLS